MFHFSHQQLQSILTGSVFFGTGGGLSHNDHKVIFEAALELQPSIPVQSAKEFSPDSHLASVYGVGDPSKALDNADALIAQAVESFTTQTGIEIAGIIPGEIGAEGLAFHAAALLELPVVDSDLVGGRAAPEIQMDVFTVRGLKLTPFLAMAHNGEQMLIEGKVTAKEIENTVRGFFTEQGGSGVIVGYAITAGEYAVHGMPDTISQTIEVGEHLMKGDVGAVLKQFDGQRLIKAELKKVELESDAGFLKGILEIGDHTVHVQNEHLLVEQGGVEVAKAPEILAIITPEGVPIHNKHIQKFEGTEVELIRIPAQGYWAEKEAAALWMH